MGTNGGNQRALKKKNLIRQFNLQLWLQLRSTEVIENHIIFGCQKVTHDHEFLKEMTIFEVYSTKKIESQLSYRWSSSRPLFLLLERTLDQ